MKSWQSAKLRRFSALAFAAVLAATLLSQLLWSARRAPVDLRISTGSEGGTYLALGGQLARILDESRARRIGQVTALPSAGSVQNAERLIRGEADLAFVVGPVLGSPEAQTTTRGLLRLYTNVAQVLVRRDARIRRLADLRGKRVFAGAPGSGTEWLATRILAAAGVDDYERKAFRLFGEAEQALREKRIDAALLVTAPPVRAVSEALNSGCCELLSLGSELASILDGVPGVIRQVIPPHTYEGQPGSVETVGSTVLLAARAGLEGDVVVEILDALFDDLEALYAASPRVQDIRIERGLEELAGIIPLHPGTIAFREREKHTLLIATGAIGGRYFTVGRRMEEILRRRGIPARVVQTDGSLENLEVLNGERQALAIVQYDAALSSHWSPTLYRSHAEHPPIAIPSTQGLRRIATLHQESMHVLVRRDKLPATLPRKPTLEQLDGLKVSLGPERSGTALIARALLREHGVQAAQAVLLSVPDTLARLNEGELDAGFFVSFVPNQSLRTAVNDERNRLLSVDPREVGALLGPTLNVARIEPGSYGSQLDGEPPVDTVATWAVLVTNEDQLYDVYEITRALFQGADFIGIDATPDEMARDLSSLPLHPDALAYYQKAGLRPSRERDWLQIAGQALGILVVLAATYGGALRLRRDRTSNAIGRKILAVPIGAEEPHSVSTLMRIRNEEIPERVQRRWWRFGELDQARWRYLHDLVMDRIQDARENHTLAMAQEIREVGAKQGLDAETLRSRLSFLRTDVWKYFHDGELDAAQQGLLLELLHEAGSEDPPSWTARGAPESGPPITTAAATGADVEAPGSGGAGRGRSGRGS